jgi:hypothetical protein
MLAPYRSRTYWWRFAACSLRLLGQVFDPEYGDSMLPTQPTSTQYQNQRTRISIKRTPFSDNNIKHYNHFFSSAMLKYCTLNILHLPIIWTHFLNDTFYVAINFIIYDITVNSQTAAAKQETRKQMDYTQQYANMKSNTAIQHVNMITNYSPLTHKMWLKTLNFTFQSTPQCLQFVSASHNHD